MKKNLTVRVDESLLGRISQLLNILARRSKGDRSQVIRRILERETTFWLESPYLAKKSNHLIVVAANGDVFYRGIQTLELKHRRSRLPARLQMKAEKIDDYVNRYKGLPDEADRIRSHWLLNHFAVWKGDRTDGPILAEHVDRLGITSKSADLLIKRQKDTIVTLERAVAVRDYVQRGPTDENSDDREEVWLNIPTLNLNMQVIVDRDLYKSNEDLFESAAVGFEFRNSESALFRLSFRDNPVGWTEDRYPDTKFMDTTTAKALQEVNESFRMFKDRISYLANATLAEGQQVVEDESARKTLLAMRLPERYLFGNLSWAAPYQGLVSCITWNRPPS